MDKIIMKKLLENKDYYNYLKENSEWVRILKRHKEKYNDFVKYVKKKYHLRAQDKVSNALDSVNVLSEVLSTLK